MPAPKEHRVAYGTQQVTFRLERRDRKTLAIEVHPDQSVRVKAPLRLSLSRILDRVEQRGAWIVRQQRRFAELPPPRPAREYVSGESYRYLGRQYRLKVTQAEQEGVRLYRERLEVGLTDPDDRARVQALLRAWYRRRAEQVFRERFEVCRKHVAAFGIDHPGGFTLRRMRKRWGSCSRDGRILLNTQLVGAPQACIDYVIVHELCHVVQHNHSAAFYALLSDCMPDWRERQRVLQNNLGALES
jgi:predicted metal-dependent hydrolase